MYTYGENNLMIASDTPQNVIDSSVVVIFNQYKLY